MKKRMMCLALVFVLTFSAAVRPRQEAYAFATAATVATVTLALIAACGVTFLSGNSQSISATVDDFLEKNASVKTFIEDLISNFGVGGKILLTEIHLYPWVKEGFSNLISAVRSYFSGDAGEGLGSGSVSIEAPSAAGWNISTEAVSDTFGPYPDEAFFRSPFVMLIQLGHNPSTDKASLLVEGAFLTAEGGYVFRNRPNASSPRLAALKLGAINVSSSTFYFKPHTWLPSDDYGIQFIHPASNPPDAYGCHLLADLGTSLEKGSFLYSASRKQVSGSSGTTYYHYCTVFDGETYGDASILQYVDWDAFLSSLPFVPYGSSSTAASEFVYAYPADVTPDLLAQKWADALETEGADVIINPVDAGELVLYMSGHL